MAKRRVHLTFPPALVSEPIIYYIGKNFDVITNIRRANITEGSGWCAIELEGPEDQIEAAIADLEARGIRVDPVERQVVE